MHRTEHRYSLLLVHGTLLQAHGIRTMIVMHARRILHLCLPLRLGPFRCKPHAHAKHRHSHNRKHRRHCNGRLLDPHLRLRPARSKVHRNRRHGPTADRRDDRVETKDRDVAFDDACEEEADDARVDVLFFTGVGRCGKVVDDGGADDPGEIDGEGEVLDPPGGVRGRGLTRSGARKRRSGATVTEVKMTNA